MSITQREKIVQAEVLDGVQKIHIPMRTPCDVIDEVSKYLEDNGYRCTACNPTDTDMVFELI